MLEALSLKFQGHVSFDIESDSRVAHDTRKISMLQFLYFSKNIKDKERLTMRFTRPSLQKIHKSIQFLFRYNLIIVAILLLLFLCNGVKCLKNGFYCVITDRK